ncbi:MAG: hypothetical protein ACREBE_02360 [bacterium]
MKPLNRGAVIQNAPKLVALFEKHGIRSEGVFENFGESEIVHLWSAASIAAYEQATAGLRGDAAFREFAGAAAQVIEFEKKEYWRAIG